MTPTRKSSFGNSPPGAPPPPGSIHSQSSGSGGRRGSGVPSALRAQRPAERAGGFGLGLLLAIVGYLVLALRQPSAWGMPVWALLAFAVVPAGAGWLAGRGRIGGSEFRECFRAGAWPAAIAMALYAGITLIVLHTRVSSGANGGSVFLVGVFVALVYAAAAGPVAGITTGLALRGKQEAGE